MSNPSEFNAGKMFIGGLSINTTTDTLRSYFEKYGEALDCVLMVDRSTGRSRGFGFVTMKESASVEKILMDAPHILDGKEIDCKKAVPKDNGPGVSDQSRTIFENNVFNRTKKIFVGGLPHNLTETEFRQHFERYGPIKDCVVMLDRVTGKPRGFGFITFEEEDDVDKVMASYKEHNIGGKWVDCKRATPKIQEKLMQSQQPVAQSAQPIPSQLNQPQQMAPSYPVNNQMMYGQQPPMPNQGPMIYGNNPGNPTTGYMQPSSEFFMNSYGAVMPSPLMRPPPQMNPTPYLAHSQSLNAWTNGAAPQQQFYQNNGPVTPGYYMQQPARPQQQFPQQNPPQNMFLAQQQAKPHPPHGFHKTNSLFVEEIPKLLPYDSLRAEPLPRQHPSLFTHKASMDMVDSFNRMNIDQQNANDMKPRSMSMSYDSNHPLSGRAKDSTASKRLSDADTFAQYMSFGQGSTVSVHTQLHTHSLFKTGSLSPSILLQKLDELDEPRGPFKENVDKKSGFYNRTDLSYGQF